MRRLCVAALTLVAACSDQVTGPPNERNSPQPLTDRSGGQAPEVHIVYLVPADVRTRRDYVQNLRDAAANLQAWYSLALGTGETFSLANPTVVTYQTSHDASWYATSPVAGSDPSLWFWYNATADGFAATGGSFGDPDDVWVFYIDAAPSCGQVTGAVASVALLPANDLRGLAGEPTINTCTGATEPDQGTCRWVGGLGHELGHALGLPHPAGCESGSPDCPLKALMWFGYLTYPDAYLTTEDRSILEQSEFISPIKLTGKVPSCESIGASALYSASVSALPGLERVTVGGAVSPSIVCAHRLLVATTRTTIAARPAP